MIGSDSLCTLHCMLACLVSLLHTQSRFQCCAYNALT